MKNWMDLNGDGKIDGAEMMFAGEMLCTSREEHEALFGDAGDFEDDAKDDFEIDAMAAGLDVDELELMDPDDRAEALEEAGLDPDDYDFDCPNHRLPLYTNAAFRARRIIRLKDKPFRQLIYGLVKRNFQTIAFLNRQIVNRHKIVLILGKFRAD